MINALQSFLFHLGPFGSLHIKVPTLTYHHKVEPMGASEARAFLRCVALALKAGVPPEANALAPEKDTFQTEQKGLLTYRLRSSAPTNGFQRTDVSRLIMTFGRLADVAPVQLGLFLEPVSQD